MNLADFVEQSLSEILMGVRAAQKKEGGAAVAAEMYGAPAKDSLLVIGGSSGTFTVVEFDVSVVAETTAGGKGGLRVWSVGIEGEGKRSDQQTSRVRFAVQLKLPRGEAAPKSGATQRVESEYNPHSRI
jgi:Trypsin-co-occurring domain 2